MLKGKVNTPFSASNIEFEIGDIVEVVGEEEEDGSALIYHMFLDGHSGEVEFDAKFKGTPYDNHLWWIDKDFIDIIKIPATLENK